jgi:uncharacterized membrane protein
MSYAIAKKNLGAAAKEHFGEELETLSKAEIDVLKAVLRRDPIAEDPEEGSPDREGFWPRLADTVARVGGSWAFIGWFGAILVAWMAFNTEILKPLHMAFDPYPFIFLNLVLSTLAAIQAPIIMMSQNRQTTRDRRDAEKDYAVNLKAELEILALHKKLDLALEKLDQFNVSQKTTSLSNL